MLLNVYRENYISQLILRTDLQLHLGPAHLSKVITVTIEVPLYCPSRKGTRVGRKTSLILAVGRKNTFGLYIQCFNSLCPSMSFW